MVLEHNQRSTFTHALRELSDASHGGHCGETMELESRKPTMLKAKEKE